MDFNDMIQEKLLPRVNKFTNLRPVQAIKDGMMFIMPLSIVGSIFLLLAEFPYAPIKEFFANIGWAPAMYQANNATMGIMAAVAAVTIPYSFAKNEKLEPLSAGVAGIVSFMLLLNWNVSVDGLDEGVAGIPTNWLGAEGVVAAIILGIIVGYIYMFLLKKDIRIKMPESVPSGVANSFSALIPIFVVTAISAIIYGVFNSLGTSFLDIIYTSLQVPLQGLSSSLGMAFILPLAIHFLWWFGIHGAVVVGSVTEPILRANLVDNAKLYQQGNLSIENGGHILTVVNNNALMHPGGSGATLGLAIFMAFFAKSKQFKTLGKLSLGPGLFNINEPLLFGTPIVMNPLMVIPFILTPLIGNVFSYLLINWGILPLPIGIEAPWTTPSFILGLIAGGWTWAAYSIMMVVISFLIYYPFAKRIDKTAYAEELGVESDEVTQAL